MRLQQAQFCYLLYSANYSEPSANFKSRQSTGLLVVGCLFILCLDLAIIATNLGWLRNIQLTGWPLGAVIISVLCGFYFTFIGTVKQLPELRAKDVEPNAKRLIRLHYLDMLLLILVLVGSILASGYLSAANH